MGHRGRSLNIILASAAIGLSACHPVGIDDASETDVVLTRTSKGYDYTRNRTYDMPETVADLCNVDRSKLPGAGGEGGGGPLSDSIDCNEINHTFDASILGQIRANLEALGYVHIDEDATEPPDVVLLAGALSTDNWVAYTSYPWAWYYPNSYYYYYFWWPAYYGWYAYYPYYPTTTIVNYPKGTLIMDLVSLKDADVDQQRTPTIWTGVVSGLLEQSDEDGVTRVKTTINQAFAQSPYLKAGKP